MRKAPASIALATSFFRHAIAALMFMLCCTLPLSASDHPRPKIGVVLSGGGARGLAHVGVLKVLNEMHIPIDYITGTSMGAIVGGLYASGVPIDDLERLVQEIDWNGILADEIPRQELPYRHKQDNDTILKLAIDPQKGAVIPKGLASAKRLDLLLKTLTIGVAQTNDFNQLPIPFKCIAADIVSGQAVTLDHGSLATAMRASMAVPGLFAPVEIDDHILVDGGILNNLPVATVKEMGADVVIVIDIGSPMVDRAKLDNFFAITDQSRKVMTQRYNTEQLALLTSNDLLLTPDLKDITSSDFGRGADLVALGYAAADQARSDLARYSIAPEDYQAFQQHRSAVYNKQINIGFVETPQSITPLNDKVRSGFEEPAKRMLNLSLLGYDLFKHSTNSGYEGLDVAVVERAGQTGLLLEPRRKAAGTSYLRFGFSLEDDFRGNPNLGLSAELAVPNINSLDAEWRTRMEMGNDRLIASEFYQPLDHYAWSLFIAPRVELSSYQIDIYRNDSAALATDRDRKIATIDRYLSDKKYAEYRANGGKAIFDTGLAMDNYGELRLGVYRGFTNARVATGGQDLPKFDHQTGGYHARYTIDQLDSANIPRRGGFLDLDFSKSSKAFSANENYKRLGLELIKPYTYERTTLIARVKAGTAFDSDLPAYDQFSLGGFLNLSGLSKDQIRANHTLLTQLIAYNEAWKIKKAFINDIIIGASIEAGAVWDRRKDVKLNRDQALFAGCIFMGTDTKLGPLALGYGYAEGGHHAVYLSIGNKLK